MLEETVCHYATSCPSPSLSPSPAYFRCQATTFRCQIVCFSI